MSRSTSAPRSSDTALGIVTVMWMSPSFIGGRNSDPRRGTSIVAPAITASATTATRAGRRIVTRSPSRYRFCNQMRNGGCFSMTGRCFSSNAVSAGTAVSVNSSAPPSANP